MARSSKKKAGTSPIRRKHTPVVVVRSQEPKEVRPPIQPSQDSIRQTELRALYPSYVPVPDGCKNPPYDPSLPIIVGNNFYKSPSKSAFSPDLQAEMMNKSHLEIISEYFLGANKMQELSHCYGFRYASGIWEHQEDAIIKEELDRFCQTGNLTKESLLKELDGKKTQLDLIQTLARRLIWREKTAIVHKLQYICGRHSQDPTKLRSYRTWSEEEHGILIEAMQEPRFQLENKQDHNKAVWKEVVLHCKKLGHFDRDFAQCRRKWRQSTTPRMQRDGYFPQFFRGDWFKLLIRLRELGFQAQFRFPWKLVEFRPFTADHLKRYWAKFRALRQGEDYQSYFDRVIEEHKKYTVDELNRKIYGYRSRDQALMDSMGKGPKRKGYKDPPRYFQHSDLFV